MKRLGIFALASLSALAPLACAASGGGDSSSAGAAFGPADVPAGPIAPHFDGDVVAYPRMGGVANDDINPLGPGVVVVGGASPVLAAFAWAEETIGEGRPGAGDVLIVRTAGDDSLTGVVFSAGGFNSVRTIVVPPLASADDLADAARFLTDVEVVVFADDDPTPLETWIGTPLAMAAQEVFDRGGVFVALGASANALGQFALDTRVAGAGSVDSTSAVDDPFDPAITFTNVFRLPPLENVLVEAHFTALDRFGLLSAFMARQVAAGTLSTSPPRVGGLGVDEGNAVVIDRFGQSTLVQDPSAQGGGGFVLVGGVPTQIAPGEPLVYDAIAVNRMDTAGESYSLGAACGTAYRYAVSIDGATPAPYSPADPYTAQGASYPCPE